MAEQPGDGWGVCEEPTCKEPGTVELISPADDWLGIYCLPHGTAAAVEGRRLRAIPQRRPTG